MAKRLLMGNQAMAHAALEAGVRVVAGYPGTPSSEIVETVAQLHTAGVAHGVHVEWSTNEKAALELLFGASLAGARGLFTCKQMGLNVASDALMSLNYVSVRGGLVLVVADDPGPISSQTEQDTRRFAAFAKLPVLDPATPEQAFDMVKAAFNLSERFHTPVIVRPTTRVDHASAFFEVEDETHAAPMPEGGFERDPSKWVIFPRRAYQAHGEINERLAQIADVFSDEDPYRAFNVMQVVGANAGEGDAATLGGAAPALGILAGGISASYTREALRIVADRVRAAGIEMPAYRFMQVATPYPFPVEAVTRFADGLQDVLVIEELDYVLEDALATWAGRTRRSIGVHGKLSGEARDRGENDVDDIAARIERFLGLSGRLRIHKHALGHDDVADLVAAVEAIPEEELPVRPPVLCPGCPHRGAFYAVKQALRGVPAVLCGDIGCYTLGNAKPLDAVDTCLCMGAGVTMAQGFSAVDPGKKAVAFIGDSTFFASGMTGLANAAYNGHDITVMVLDNATTAMTGSQPHPGTGRTLMGAQNKPLSIESVLVSCGFSPVYHANPLDKDASVVAAKAAISHAGPSAVIFESPCVQLIKPSTPVAIDRDACMGCKKCITEIGCPAIGFDKLIVGARSKLRGQAFIDSSLCNGCGLCTQVCPFRAISVPVEGAVPLEPLGVEPRELVGRIVNSTFEPQSTGRIPVLISEEEYAAKLEARRKAEAEAAQREAEREAEAVAAQEADADDPADGGQESESAPEPSKLAEDVEEVVDEEASTAGKGTDEADSESESEEADVAESGDAGDEKAERDTEVATGETDDNESAVDDSESTTDDDEPEPVEAAEEPKEETEESEAAEEPEADEEPEDAEGDLDGGADSESDGEAGPKSDADAGDDSESDAKRIEDPDATVAITVDDEEEPELRGQKKEDGDSDTTGVLVDGIDRLVFGDSDLAEVDIMVDDSNFAEIDFGSVADGGAGYSSWPSRWPTWNEGGEDA